MFQQQITDKELMLVIEEDNLNEAFREIADILIKNIGDPDRIDKVAESFI